MAQEWKPGMKIAGTGSSHILERMHLVTESRAGICGVDELNRPSHREKEYVNAQWRLKSGSMD